MGWTPPLVPRPLLLAPPLQGQGQRAPQRLVAVRHQRPEVVGRVLDEVDDESVREHEEVLRSEVERVEDRVVQEYPVEVAPLLVTRLLVHLVHRVVVLRLRGPARHGEVVRVRARRPVPDVVEEVAAAVPVAASGRPRAGRRRRPGRRGRGRARTEGGRRARGRAGGRGEEARRGRRTLTERARYKKKEEKDKGTLYFSGLLHRDCTNGRVHWALSRLWRAFEPVSRTRPDGPGPCVAEDA